MNRILFLFLLISSSVFGQLSYERRIVKHLCSPELKGRGYVEDGDSLAAAYIAAEFEKLGIKPYADTYFQNFSFAVNTFPNTLLVQLEGKTLTPGIDYVVDPASGGGKCESKIRFFTLHELMSASFVQLLDSCKKRLIIPAFALYKIKNKDTLQLVKKVAHELAAKYCPAILVQKKKFTWSVAQKQYVYPLLHIRDTTCNGDKIKINIHAKWIQNHSTRNVIAYLPAIKKSKQTIVFSAHYDHLGKMGSEAYFPGGNDNASGVAMILTLAKALKGNNPNNSYVFIAFAGEEAGLLGSHYYVQHPVFPLKRIDFLLNLDIMGSGEEGITVVNGSVFKNIYNQLYKINTEKKYLPVIKIRGKAANSDHYWFSENGVQAFFFYTMGPNKHYHDVYDSYEELSFDAFESIKNLILDFVCEVKF